MASYVRNIQGHAVTLTLTDIDPRAAKLDPTNPRLGFSMRQLPAEQRTEEACILLLVSQEETEALKRSIILSNGVQEPIYIRWDGRVAEGNRRVVAVRAAASEQPEESRFASIPAWVIPEGTPEHVVQDLLNEIHIGRARGWAPYEKALQMRALVASGLTENEVAERYRVSEREVMQQLRAVELMDALYFPITADPTDAEHRAKFSYFFEFVKSRRLQELAAREADLPAQFARWVRDGHIDTGMRVRKLAKVLDSNEARRLLNVIGFEAAEKHLEQEHPEEQELYSIVERARSRLREMNVDDLAQLAASADRQALLRALGDQVMRVLDVVGGDAP
jgi:hypothetical protein